MPKGVYLRVPPDVMAAAVTICKRYLNKPLSTAKGNPTWPYDDWLKLPGRYELNLWREDHPHPGAERHATIYAVSRPPDPDDHMIWRRVRLPGLETK